MKPCSARVMAMVGQAAREKQLFRPGDTVIVAISGGADSSALLDLLSRLPSCPLHLVAAHLNHCLRGDESDGDEAFCREQARTYGIPFEYRRVDVAALSRTSGRSLEDAGREARIDFLNEVMGRWQASVAALAHHADDQAETVLMRLLRGSSSPGLAGIPWRNDRGYVRPLLGVTRGEIEHYLTEQQLPWRTDSSNHDTAYLRNRIRHELLPLLEQYNPSVRERLGTTARLLSLDNDLLDSLAENEFSRMRTQGAGVIHLEIPRFKSLHPALAGRVIRLAFGQISGSLRHLAQHHVSTIHDLMTDGAPNSAICLPKQVAVRREYDRLLFYRTAETASSPAPVMVNAPGRYQLWDGMQLDLALATHVPDFAVPRADTMYVDLARAPFPWQIRTFQPGDRISPFGMTGSKKLKELFIDSKVPRKLRSRIPLIFCNSGLLWVGGIRRSAMAAVTDGTTSMVACTLRRDAANPETGNGEHHV